MVECEYTRTGSETESATGFNRYMVECEYSLSNISFALSLVLIDTWWNVNLKRGYITQQELEVLIDTWWNVNQLNTVKGTCFLAGFNRYMVECELKDDAFILHDKCTF